VLDKILIDAAVEAGADLLESVSVNSLLVDEGRVVGIRGLHETPITARLTIGADGRHSRVARLVAAPAYETVRPLMCWYFTYFRDVPEPGFEMHVLPQRRVIFTHPTNDDLLAAFVGWPIDEYPSVRSNIERSFLDAVDLAPGLGPRLRSGRRVERFYGTADLPNFLREPHGPGWALVGDAGCHKDPLQARGISDALLDAELLADAVHEGLSGGEPLELALAAYECRRDDALLPGYCENVQAARLYPIPTNALRLRQALRDSPEDATRYFLEFYGRIPSGDLGSGRTLQQPSTGSTPGGAPAYPPALESGTAWSGTR
jgi:flavin-dependent dehydrogenase